LTPLGEIASEYWKQIPSHHAGVEIDEFSIMPNHGHGIVIISERSVETLRTVETLHVETLPATSLQHSAISPRAGSLSTIIRSYKSAVTKWAGLNGYSSFVWQARFHDSIIRDEASLNRVRQYIIDNPLKWVTDNYYKS
jgi:REP element-mobilizing transposase RayT